jgi:hypothetical protein
MNLYKTKLTIERLKDVKAILKEEVGHTKYSDINYRTGVPVTHLQVLKQSGLITKDNGYYKFKNIKIDKELATKVNKVLYDKNIYS